MSRKCIMGCPEGMRLHIFPENADRRAEWLRNLGVESSIKRLYACSRHFSQEYLFGNRTSKYATPININAELNANMIDSIEPSVTNLPSTNLTQENTEKLSVLPNKLACFQQKEDIQTDTEKTLNKKSEYNDSKKRTHKFEFSNYVQIFPEEDSLACLLETCDEMIKGIRPSYVKRHFFNKHSMCILYEDKFIATLEDYEQFFNERYNETFYYPIDKFLTKHCNENNLYKCVFQNCTYRMTKDLNIIRNHYLQEHKILLIKTTDSRKKKLNFFVLHKELFDKNCQKTNECIKDLMNMSKANENLENSLKSKRNRKIYPLFKRENYVVYCPENNISKCFIKTCKTYLTNISNLTIKNHFLHKHNFKILQRSDIPPFEEIKRNLKDLNFMNFLHQQQCLFINCNEVLKYDWTLIQKHYYEKHKILINKNNNNQKPSENKNRSYSATSQSSNDMEDYNNDNDSNEEEDDSNPEDHDNESTASNDNSSNKTNSDDENEEIIKEPKAKRLKINTNEIENCLTTTYINPLEDKTELKENFQSSNNTPTTKENVQDILIEKHKFLLLCLAMTIQYDLRLEQFDDIEYLKPLLAPYEERINSDVNAKIMENLIINVNRSIMEEMKKCFSHKIICLELYVLRCELQNYLIFNARYVEEEKVQNRIIGYLPVTEATTSIPISEFLNKFNIDEQQIYIKTIATIQDNEEIYNICNNLLKHNPDLKKHPLYELQIILRSFKDNYSEDLKKWQILTNYKEKSMLNIWQNLKDFAKYVKILIDKNNQLKPKLKEAKNFFKTLQMFWNFFSKLQGEQYVVGDFYRDLLACELELENDVTKNNNKYAKYLKEQLTKWKNSLIETNEFLSTLYLDVRFNFLGTRLINEEQKLKAKKFLVQIWEKFNNLVNTTNIMEDNKDTQDVSADDEYALLDQYFNNNCNVSLQDKLTIWVPVEREPFGFDILTYWSNTRQDMLDVKELMKITYTFPASQYIIKNLQQHFRNLADESIEYDRFIIKFNLDILEEKGDLMLKDLR